MAARSPRPPAGRGAPLELFTAAGGVPLSPSLCSGASDSSALAQIRGPGLGGAELRDPARVLAPPLAGLGLRRAFPGPEEEVVLCGAQSGDRVGPVVAAGRAGFPLNAYQRETLRSVAELPVQVIFWQHLTAANIY